MITRLVCGFLLILAAPSVADEVQCAVAANFIGCFEKIADAFEDSTGHTVVISPGSTGRHYAQIKQGAPFDLFFAADVERPRLLEEEDRVVPGSRTTYAEGKLVFWSRVAEQTDLRSALAEPHFHHLAIADPRLAPYGAATRQVLEHLGLWEDLQPRLVTGRSVGQAWHFAASGAADAGFIAASQVPAKGPDSGVFIPVPPELHDPILQQVVLLKPGRPAARELLAFVVLGPGRDIVAAHGYRLSAAVPTP